MAYQQVPLELMRDGRCTPWGFRMTGGADIGTPLVIQKVIYGSPSEGELRKGDILLRIQDKDAARLSHQVATDLISKAGSTIKLIVARQVSQGSSGSPLPTSVSTPLRMDGGSPLFKPLPTTNFATQRQRRSSVESYTSTASSDTEKDAIVSQPFRSIPLILPGAKTSKDIPTGSYLRFDPLTKRTSTPPNIGLRGDSYMLTKVQEAVLEAAQTSSNVSSPGRVTPDLSNGPPFFLRQYNSPIHMYSNQAIVEALAAQTTTRNPSLSNADILDKKKLSNIQDSPTYQMIHDEEWKKGKVQEFEPLQEHVYNVLPQHNYREDIHQSGSFKNIMHDLRGVSDF